MSHDDRSSTTPSRRTILAMAAASGAMAATGAAQAQTQTPALADIPIIDAHIHLFDGRVVDAPLEPAEHR